MRKTMVWAGLALSALLALSGCHDIRQCTIGTEGCLGGPPNDNGSCEDGLVVLSGRCEEPGSGGSSSCNCNLDEACDEATGACIGYCDYVDEPPTPAPTPQGCEAPSASGAIPYTYRDVCISTCEQTCLRAQMFCPGHTCDVEDCDSAAALLRCNMACPAQDLACMTRRCEEQRDTACEAFQCPTGTGPRDCSNIRCTDSCPGDNAKDGFCDDGDPQSADYNFCPYGTDCSDCGPRQGSRPPRAALGEPCPAGQDVACEGYNDNFTKTEAWCVNVLGSSSAPYRCVPDCTATTSGGGPSDCPGFDYSCEPVLTRDGEPFTDVYSNPGYYCQPLVCE